MLKKLKIGKKLMLGFLLIAVISGIVGVVSIVVLSQFRDRYDNTLERYGFGQKVIPLRVSSLRHRRKNCLLRRDC